MLDTVLAGQANNVSKHVSGIQGLRLEAESVKKSNGSCVHTTWPEETCAQGVMSYVGKPFNSTWGAG